MRLLRLVWKLSVMAGVFGVGYIIGREHSFEEEEMWENEEPEESEESGDDDERDVEFELEDAQAQKASVVGTFNDWKKDANPMTKEGDIWKCSLKLKPGKYEYQFVINDTDWIVDPKSDNNVKNKYQGENSVIEID